MDSQARCQIQEWLSRTTEEPRETTTLGGTLPNAALAGARIRQEFRANNDNTDLSITDANKPGQRQPVVELMGCDYGRRARHKTKEDRYEYKGGRARGKGILGAKEKKKAANRIRRHTINDDFHASCVPANRLTLRRALDTGIFKKGKASTPVRSRRVSEVFSEVDFLSRSSFANSERLLNAQDRDTEGLEQQSTTGVSERLRTDHLPTNLLREKGVQEPLSISSIHSLVGNARREGIDESLEIYTKGLLHFDLDAWDTGELMSEASSTKRYWTLEDLKCLLEERIKSRHSGQERKRKRSLSLEPGTSISQQHGRTRKESLGGNTEGIWIVKPRLDDVTLSTLEGFREIPNFASVELEQDRLCWSPRCDQGSHDFMIFDQESISPINLTAQVSHEQSMTNIENEFEKPGTEMPKNEMDWTYDKPSISNTIRDDPGVDHWENLALYALDTAYDMIVDSDKNSLYEAVGDGKLKPTEDSLMGDVETTRLIHQACQSFGIPDEESQPLHSSFAGVRQFEPPRSSFSTQDIFDGQEAVHQNPCTGEPSEMRCYVRQPPAYQPGFSGQQTRNALDSEEELPHGLKGFWRQNKLY